MAHSMNKKILIFTLLFSSQTFPALLDLADTPLFLGIKVDPNVFF